MTTKAHVIGKHFTRICYALLFLLIGHVGHSQEAALLKRTNNGYTDCIIKEYVSSLSSSLGIGVNSPDALFHIKGSFGRPIFMLEATNYGSIKHLFLDGNIKYGIYQTHQNGVALLNYFQDPVQIGNVLIKSEGFKSFFKTDWNINSIDFLMNPSSSPTELNPLTISGEGIRVRSNLITDGFQLLTSPGLGKVLVSDDLGNGTWTEASNFNDNDWLVSRLGGNGPIAADLYLNPDYSNVGIGVIPNGNAIAKLSVLNSANPVGVLINSSYADPATSQYGLLVTHSIGDHAIKSPTITLPENIGIYSSLANNSVFTGSVIGISSNVLNTAHCGERVIGVKSIVNCDSEDQNVYGIYSQLFINGEVQNDRWAGYFGNGDLQLDNGRFIVGSKYKKNFLIYTDYLNPEGSHTLWICPQDENGLPSTANGVRLNDDGEFIAQNKMITNDLKVNSLCEANEVLVNHDLRVNHRLLVGTSTFPADPGGTGKVAVEGKLYAREIEVNIDSWPDNVFNAGYNLKSLKEVEQYIQLNKHLPDVPSETTVKNEGLNLGEMNAVLLKKVEELTLYVIQLEKEIKVLQEDKTH